MECPKCNTRMVIGSAETDPKTYRVSGEYECPKCKLWIPIEDQDSEPNKEEREES